MNRVLSIVLLLCGFATGQIVITGGVSFSGNVDLGLTSVIIVPADYYIAPASGNFGSCLANGSDGNAGTSASAPFATPAHAESVIKASGKLGTKPLTVVICGPATNPYFNTSITFGSGDSGSVPNPITWEAYPGDSPMLSGGTNVGGSGWTTCTTGTCAPATANGFTVYQKAIANTNPYFETLYYQKSGGVMGRRMRTRMGATASTLWGTYGISTGPLSGSGNGCGTISKGSAICGVNYTVGDPVTGLTSCNTGTDCEIYSFSKWAASIGRISSINTTAHTITTTCTGSQCPSTNDGNGGSFLTNERYIVENAKELLKFGGQWYLDRSASNPNNPNWTLYYVAQTGENPNSDIVVIPKNNQVVTATSLQNAIFNGITFAHDNYTVPSTGFISTQLDHNLTTALFLCSSCVNVQWFNNFFMETIVSGLRLTDSSKNLTVGSANNGNFFLDLGGYGIQSGVYAPQGGNTDALNPNHITVAENWFDYNGRFFPSGDCVMAGLTSNVSFINNDVGYCYDKGFEICQPSNHTCKNGTATDHDILIQGNDVHNIVQGVMTDAAGFYASTETLTIPGGAGPCYANCFLNNRVHDVNGAIVQNASEPDSGVHCLYLDDFTGQWTISNNLMYRKFKNSFL